MKKKLFFEKKQKMRHGSTFGHLRSDSVSVDAKQRNVRHPSTISMADVVVVVVVVVVETFLTKQIISPAANYDGCARAEYLISLNRCDRM